MSRSATGLERAIRQEADLCIAVMVALNGGFVSGAFRSLSPCELDFCAELASERAFLRAPVVIASRRVRVKAVQR